MRGFLTPGHRPRSHPAVPGGRRRSRASSFSSGRTPPRTWRGARSPSASASVVIRRASTCRSVCSSGRSRTPTAAPFLLSLLNTLRISYWPWCSRRCSGCCSASCACRRTGWCATPRWRSSSWCATRRSCSRSSSGTWRCCRPCRRRARASRSAAAYCSTSVGCSCRRRSWGADAWIPAVVLALALVALPFLWRRRVGTLRLVWLPLAAARRLRRRAVGARSRASTIRACRVSTSAAGPVVPPELVALWLGLSIYGAAFIAEIVRGSIEGVAKGQREAAQALALTPRQSMLRRSSCRRRSASWCRR